MAISQSLPYPLQQTQLVSQVNTLAANPLLGGNPVTQIMLNANTPKTFSHGLGKVPQGWIITDIMSDASVWRTQPFNSTTLTLEASAETTINILVF